MSKKVFPYISEKADCTAMIASWMASLLREARKQNLFCEIEIRHGRFKLNSPEAESKRCVLRQISMQTLLIVKTNSK